MKPRLFCLSLLLLQHFFAFSAVFTEDNIHGIALLPFGDAIRLYGNYPSTKIITDARCNQNNGKIEVVFTADQPAAFRWQNSAGQTVGRTRILDNSFPGTYDLYITDDLAVERLYLSYTINNKGGDASVKLTTAVNTADQCGLGKGILVAPEIAGGQEPYSYEWRDANGQFIWNGAYLGQIKAGVYHVKLGDASGCIERTISYTVQNKTVTFPTPTLNDVRLCMPGKTSVKVQQPSSGTYSIYDVNNNLIEKSDAGAFTLTVNKSQEYKVIHQQGSCLSAPALVRITVENEGLDIIPNIFSPNGDGLNDQWIIPGLSSYPAATIVLYGRYGNKVFESVGYGTPFDGNYRGTALPAGTYYYLINLHGSCGLQKGSVTIIR